jgi:hypothetical protein
MSNETLDTLAVWITERGRRLDEECKELEQVEKALRQ